MTAFGTGQIYIFGTAYTESIYVMLTETCAEQDTICNLVGIKIFFMPRLLDEHNRIESWAITMMFLCITLAL